MLQKQFNYKKNHKTIHLLHMLMTVPIQELKRL